MIRKLMFLLTLCFTTQLAASEDTALFWKVTSKNVTVYMLGSIHYADKSFYPLRREIEKAFEASDVLVVEVKMDAEGISSYRELIASEGTYTGGKTIKDHISKELYEELKRQLEQLGVPLELVEKQKPGVLVLTLASIHALRLGLDPELGIDRYFLLRAGKDREVVALETIEEQLRIFLDNPNEDLMLKESLHTIDSAEVLVNKVVDEWKRGDEKRLHQLLFEDALKEYPEFTSIYDRLIYQRNINMAKAIKSYLDSEGVYFVVVGAGHYLGEKGIIRLLEKSGYSAKRI